MIHKGDGALSQLEQLGLKDDWLRRALQRGDAEAGTVSPLAPKGFEGMTRWGRSAEFLREELCANAWFRDDFQNIARSVHPDGEFCIVVTTGAKGTGREDTDNPETKYPKGPGIAACVELNYMIDFDPEDLAKVGIQPTIDQPLTTWLLLFSVEDNQIWFELSRPKFISSEGPHYFLGRADSLPSDRPWAGSTYLRRLHGSHGSRGRACYPTITFGR